MLPSAARPRPTPTPEKDPAVTSASPPPAQVLGRGAVAVPAQMVAGPSDCAGTPLGSGSPDGQP